MIKLKFMEPELGLSLYKKFKKFRKQKN